MVVGGRVIPVGSYGQSPAKECRRNRSQVDGIYEFDGCGLDEGTSSPDLVDVSLGPFDLLVLCAVNPQFHSNDTC